MRVDGIREMPLPPADLRFRISEALKERTVGANEGIIT